MASRRNLLASLVLATTLAGCGLISKPPRTELPPVPERGEEKPAQRAPSQRPEAPDAARRPEEKVETPLPAAAPSPLATIDDATPPQVAAATRLADKGRELLAAGNDDAALEALERAISVDPSNPYAYFFLAELHLRHRSYDQAVAFADRAALLSARLNGTWLTRSYALQGQAQEAAGQFDEARSAYRRALNADRRNQVARAGLARVEGKLGNEP